MKLSVIVPVCRQEEWVLRRCFDSILAQTEPDWELLAVNDAPGDETVCRLFAEYGRRDPRFHGILLTENGGVSHARNCALDAAQGEYVGFVDADDAIQPGFYRTLLSLAERENCDMVSAEGYLRLQEKEGLPAESPFVLPESLPVLSRSVYLDRVIWNRIYRRSKVADLRFSTELNAFEDMVYLCRAFLRCKRSAAIFYPGYGYYHYPARQARPQRKSAYAKDVHLEALKMLSAMRADAPVLQRKGLSYLILRRLLRAVLQERKLPEASRAAYLQGWNAAWQESLHCCAEDFPVSSRLTASFLKLPGGTVRQVLGTLLRLWVELAALPENRDRLRRFLTLRRKGGMLSVHP